MRTPLRLALWALCVVVLAGCASATKRYDQGMELQMQGRHEAAVSRYVQALEKDPTLVEAREQLHEAGGLAIDQRLADSAHLAGRGDLPQAARQYHAIDGIVARARHVGVPLELPASYEIDRRVAFDHAIASLVEDGQRAWAQGRWESGLDCYRSARLDFEASREQREEALAGESGLLVDWGEHAFEAGRLRLAHEIAGAVLELDWTPDGHAARAGDLMQDALAAGEVQLLILPVGSEVRSRRSPLPELALQVDRDLGVGPWRHPPDFVSLSDPLAVRDLLRHSGLMDREFRAPAMAGLLRLAGADYGAWMQISGFSEAEFDVRVSRESAKHRDGTPVHFDVEKGKRRLVAQVHVVLVDDFGNEVASAVVAGSGIAHFARGVYDGDARDLSLRSRQLDWFDELAQERQLQAARDALVQDLVGQVAQAVYGPVLAQVP